MLKEDQTLKDQTARDRIVRDLDTTFLVEAGAGSGKTTSLVARMIELIKQNKAAVDQIAAITFTNKAASELRSRFRLRLEMEAKKETNTDQKQRLELALQQVSQCFIGTIHAFCGQLLRERPIEAGLDPDFEEMDDLAARDFRDRCWDDYLEQLRMRGEDEGIEQLDRYGVDVNLLREVFRKVSAYEDVSIFTETVEKPDFEQMLEKLREYINQAFMNIPSNARFSEYDKMQEAVVNARKHLNVLDLNDENNVLRIARLFDRNLQVTLKKWIDNPTAKQLRDVTYPYFRDEVIKPFLRQWREHLHPQLIRIVTPAIEFAASAEWRPVSWIFRTC